MWKSVSHFLAAKIGVESVAVLGDQATNILPQLDVQFEFGAVGGGMTANGHLNNGFMAVTVPDTGACGEFIVRQITTEVGTE